MSPHVMGLQEIDRSMIGLAGGKGASLGELSRLDGVRVPAGFCVTTEGFARHLAQTPAIQVALGRLAALGERDGAEIRSICAEIRQIIEEIPIAPELEEAIARALLVLGEQTPCAVRSSATAEDLPTASFAGLHDSALDVRGRAGVLEQVRRCWASLYTERAARYRLQRGVDHGAVRMAVVVQRLVPAVASGTLFTADPLSSNRKVCAVEAVFGLGELLVSGRVEADGWRVRGGRVIERRVAPERQGRPALTDEQLALLEGLGRRIEARFGAPQDIEWCLAEDGFQVVQSRPITTLYPIPEGGRREGRVYISVGHQQMMTDALKPLGRSVFQLTAMRPMYEAGGRLFVDPTDQLASPASRDALLGMLRRNEPLIADALSSLLARGELVQTAPAASGPAGPPRGAPPGIPAAEVDDRAVVAELVADTLAAVEASRREIEGRAGVDLLDFIVEDLQRLKQSLAEPRSLGAIMGGLNAASWLNDHMLDWLGEKDVADLLARSAPNNVSSEMGLALLDVADAIRPHPAVVDWLERATDANLLKGLLAIPGGSAAHDALSAFLDRYGVRCSGEIDLTRPRWRESPTALVPLILSHVRQLPPGERARRFERGRREAEAKEAELLERLLQLPDGERKAAETRRMTARLRALIGYREFPKYGIVSRFFVYRQALLAEADRLVAAGVLHEPADIDYLTLEELREVVRTGALDPALLRARREEHERFCGLAPPRVITSEGELVAGSYGRAELPEGALVGLAVSSGVVEGRARIVLDMAQARLAEGDILVTPFTDPSWTPLFVAVRGLVTEVGGLMTHGAVIAREYGLPAVVGVLDATRRIRDGQRLRVNGTEGTVELLD